MGEANGDVEKAARALVAAANAKGGEDNITVLILRFEE
jgi:serine/threonine protein phosphatase PrpC